MFRRLFLCLFTRKTFATSGALCFFRIFAGGLPRRRQLPTPRGIGLSPFLPMYGSAIFLPLCSLRPALDCSLPLLSRGWWSLLEPRDVVARPWSGLPLTSKATDRESSTFSNSVFHSRSKRLRASANMLPRESVVGAGGAQRRLPDCTSSGEAKSSSEYSWSWPGGARVQLFGRSDTPVVQSDVSAWPPPMWPGAPRLPVAPVKAPPGLRCCNGLPKPGNREF
mmetsp:Transcript_62714/g.124001  ORF Transcript_62714/g.124001 Transcript_62714/m.124001 type:complete len:223 (+) Transcript_62714:220-888(+)